MTAPLPEGSDPQTEYLRRAAEAAEATRRNSRILVIALVVVPLVVAAVVVIVWIAGSAVEAASKAQARSGMAAVEEAARSVSYTPPAYTTISNQVQGICQNLATGMSTQDAAQKMAQGFGDGMEVQQAKAIVEAVDREVC